MSLLDPGFDLTLRPMQYPKFYEYFINAQANNWTVQEISFATDQADLRDKINPQERRIVNRIVAFFATGDSIVANNLVLNLYRHVNSPEARMYYGRQLFEEQLHVQFYLQLIDEYIQDPAEQKAAFDAIENIPSIKKKADFCFKYIDSIFELDEIKTDEDRKKFLMNLIGFAAVVEGLFFFAAFAYVYYLRSKNLLHGFADGTNWVFRDESMHMNFAFEVVDQVKKEYPHLWDDEFELEIRNMIKEAVDCEYAFAEDTIGDGVLGLSLTDMKQYLQYVADLRFVRLGLEKEYNVKNPLSFMVMQDMTSFSGFFERTPSDYQVGLSGAVGFNEDF